MFAVLIVVLLVKPTGLLGKKIQEKVAKMMGHADITSTQVYAQVTEQKISNDMDKLIAKRERNKNPMA